MNGKITHLLPQEPPAGGRGVDWADELKTILSALVDLTTRVILENGQKFSLNEVLTAEELAKRFKLPISTVLEMARLGKLPGAFRVGKHWRFDLDVLRKSVDLSIE